jgi:hypothetical protein
MVDQVEEDHIVMQILLLQEELEIVLQLVLHKEIQVEFVEVLIRQEEEEEQGQQGLLESL